MEIKYKCKAGEEEKRYADLQKLGYDVHPYPKATYPIIIWSAKDRRIEGGGCSHSWDYSDWNQFLTAIGEYKPLAQNSFYYKMPNAETGVIIGDLFAKLGFKWHSNSRDQVSQGLYLSVVLEKGMILTTFNLSKDKYSSLEDILRNVAYNVPEAPIKVGEYSVLKKDISKDSVKVGCQTIAFESVEKIYVKMLELRR